MHGDLSVDFHALSAFKFVLSLQIWVLLVLRFGEIGETRLAGARSAGSALHNVVLYCKADWTLEVVRAGIDFRFLDEVLSV